MIERKEISQQILDCIAAHGGDLNAAFPNPFRFHNHKLGRRKAFVDRELAHLLTERDPYRLAKDIRGIGFKTADAIAMKLGIEKTAMMRVRAGISYALSEAMNEGHCELPTDKLSPLAVELLEVPAELIETALGLELHDGTVVADTVDGTPCIFLAGLYRAEQAIAERLFALTNGTLPWPFIDAGKALPWIEQKPASPWPKARLQQSASRCSPKCL